MFIGGSALWQMLSKLESRTPELKTDRSGNKKHTLFSRTVSKYGQKQVKTKPHSYLRKTTHAGS